MRDKIRVLLVVDSERDTKLLVRELERSGYTVAWKRVETGDEMRAALKAEEWDMILSDHNLPKFSSREALAVLRGLGVDIPFIIVSGAIGEDVAVAAMRAGAHDFIIKGQYARLVPAVKRELVEAAVRRKKKLALEKSSRLSRIIENSLNEIYIFDAETLKFLEVNRGARENLGYTVEELMRLTPLYLKPEYTEKTFAELTAPLRRGESKLVTSTTAHKRKDGSLYPVEVRLQLYQKEDPPVFVATIQDITERKKAEDERERLIAELEIKNAELERFVYTVSHDIKSPLITIKGFLGLLEKDALEGNIPRLKEDVEEVRFAASQMGRLLDDLLELARIGRVVNPPEEVSLGDLAREAVSLVSGQISEKGAQVEIALDFPIIRVDRPRFLEVMQNLVDNAVKYTGEQKESHVEIGSRQDGEERVFYVRDNGMGIDPRYHEKIFGLFDKLDPESEGTGIGLALVKRIVEAHSGRVWVESEGAEKGSSFCFTVGEKLTWLHD